VRRSWAIVLCSLCCDGAEPTADAEPTVPTLVSVAPPAARPSPVAEAPKTAELPDPPPVESPVPPAGPAPPPIAVALFSGSGVDALALEETTELLSSSPGFRLQVISPPRVRGTALEHADVVVFTGGSGSAQGKALGEEGRARVRGFVERGGGYVGVCAGSYLALQGEEEFNKLALVAARNKTGDFWKRGIKAINVAALDSQWAGTMRMHFANGPVFARDEVEGLPRYVELARFADEIWSAQNGTGPGEMKGTPAIVASRVGRGRVLLFSPNPVLGGGDVGHPDMMLDAIRFVAAGSVLPRDLGFDDVFHGPG
jgi:glutamine amidotransferase-like uncharacterized protein